MKEVASAAPATPLVYYHFVGKTGVDVNVYSQDWKNLLYLQHNPVRLDESYFKLRADMHIDVKIH